MLAPTLMTESVSTPIETWCSICSMNDIVPFTGVAALVGKQQVAIFRLNMNRADGAQCYAISNYDPFSKANVIARGIVGDKNGVIKVASPLYKNTFNLLTGHCLEDETIRLQTWPTRVVDGNVQIAIQPADV